MSDDPSTHLQILKHRNDELEQKYNKLQELSRNLEENISKVQQMYEMMLTSQENQCVDMVHFDEEIKTLTKTLFPSDTVKVVKPRKRQENSNLILSQILDLQRLPPKQIEERLQEDDPLLKRVRQETQLLQQFMKKYSSFL